ncbi:MAG: SH3 domain-containing protein [Clostridiales bacterium]|nr:SH3 domain-containing protein [Clostridiales bacterium]
MIRTLVTAHINSLDLNDLTIQINDRSLGYLTGQKPQNYFASTNRRVQMISGIRSDRLDQESIVQSRDMLRKWAAVFRELQIYGLDVFPSILKREKVHADFIFLICDEIVIALVSRYLGLYLHRNGRLYRQQPAVIDSAVIPGSFMPAADYYAFVPAEGDILLALDPHFVDLFEPQGLEEILSDPRQITVQMSELNNLASAYGYSSDHTWVGFKVTRIERPLHANKTRLQKIPTSKEYLSRVIPIAGSNRLVLEGQRDTMSNNEDKKVYVPGDSHFPRFSGSHRLGGSRNEHEASKIRIQESDPNYERRPSSLHTQIEHEANIGFLDRLKMLEFKRCKQLWNRFLYRLTHLFPSSRPLSLLALISIILVVLVFSILLFTSLKGDKKTQQNEDVPKISQPLANAESGEAVATDFEIKLTIKAQSMQIMSAPGSTELVATATRGDTVWQLTKEDKDGWVMVRLTDGRTGYVPLTVLLPGE